MGVAERFCFSIEYPGDQSCKLTITLRVPDSGLNQKVAVNYSKLLYCRKLHRCGRGDRKMSLILIWSWTVVVIYM